jgi:hypothetical protein
MARIGLHNVRLEDLSLRKVILSKLFHPSPFFKQNIFVDLVILVPETHILPAGALPRPRLDSGTTAPGAIVQVKRQRPGEDLSHASLTGSETTKHT